MPLERTFDLPGFKLAGIEWGSPGNSPVIALHGWLDNAGTFDNLAPLLGQSHIVALDSAGHGFSGHRSPDAAYNIWQDVADIFAVADQLGWQQFSLLGHSRGAAIAVLCAGTFPDRIKRLALIDGGVAFGDESADAPRTLAKSIGEHKLLRTKTGRVFAERHQAIVERSRGFTRITISAAEILALRSLREVEGGYTWHVDQRLKAESELRLTKSQVAAFLEAVEAPAIAFLASGSPFSGRKDFRQEIAKIRQLRIVEIEGGHHCHLEGGENEIAALAGPFLYE